MPGRYTHPMFSLTSGRLSKRCFCRIGRWYFSTSPTQEFFIHEVTPRDGLQNESAVLDVDQKLQLIQGLVQTNPSSIEVCSFVREDRVPAMKGSQELVRRMNEEQWALDAKRAGMNFAALVPNHRGFDTFQNTAGDILDTVVVLTSCTDSHSKANVGLPLAEALDTSCGIIRNALAAGFRVVAFVSLAFGCPFEGAVDPKVVKDIVEAYKIPTMVVDDGKDYDKIRSQIREFLDHKGPIVMDFNCHEYHTYDPKIVGWETPIEDMYPYLPDDEFDENMFIKPIGQKRVYPKLIENKLWD